MFQKSIASYLFQGISTVFKVPHFGHLGKNIIVESGCPRFNIICPHWQVSNVNTSLQVSHLLTSMSIRDTPPMGFEYV